MDAGEPAYEAGILFQNMGNSIPEQRSHLTQFFNAGSNTVLGAFGSGLGVWGRSHYAPFFARSLTPQQYGPGQEPPNFALGGCHLDGQFDSSAFYPRWRWESANLDNWTYPNPRLDPADHSAETFVDVDGDGYADAIRPEPTSATSDFQHGRVAFTLKYGTGDSGLPLNAQGQYPLGPGLLPFSESSAPSLVPHASTWDPAPTGRKTQVFYADMNGDGLPRSRHPELRGERRHSARSPRRRHRSVLLHDRRSVGVPR